MKNIRIIFTVILVLMPLVSLAKVEIAATTKDIASITQVVGGAHVKVESLTQGTQDPHFASAKPSMIRKLSHVDLLIAIGAEMEIGWLPALQQSARNSHILSGENGYLDLSQYVELKGKPSGHVTRAQGDVHAAGNPHYWLDPLNGIKMAEAIAQRLILLDAEHTADYEKNLQGFKTRIEHDLLRWKQEMIAMKGEKVIAYHTSLLYLAEAFEFEIVDFIEPLPGISPSVSHVNQLINKIKQQNIKYVLLEPYYEIRSAEMLQRRAGTKTLIIPQSVGSKSEITDYEKLFDVIVNVFKANR